jgi:hypothetical protein
VKRRKPSRRQKNRASAPNLGDFSQQLASLDWGIILGHAITPGNEKRLVPREVFAYDPVNEKAVLTHVKHDLTRLDLLRGDGADGDKVAGPQSWEHAESGSTQLQEAPRLQRFRRQTASALVMCLSIH